MSDVPLILDSLIEKAIVERASDIHIEPHPNNVRVRFRIDGVLQDHPVFETAVGHALISRIKVIGQLDIAQSRMPQDGSFNYGDSSDIRVATFPTLYGEKVVLRIFDRKGSKLTLEDLGMDNNLRSKLKAIAQAQQGFFLVTGPTGSGKTTTLHAMLAHANLKERNCVTLEDPIEYIVHGVTQSAIQPESGFTFESGLRALLRQDPDVIMIGEIRDSNTARVALQAALTGHLVLSTIHTNDAASALIRLTDMGVEPYLIAAALKGVVAQRLIRVICQQCKQENLLSDSEKSALNEFGIIFDRASSGIGCNQCRATGYYGRLGIFEYLELTPAIRAYFMGSRDYDALVAHAKAEGFKNLAFDLEQKLESGMTSVAESLRSLL